eukprot:TRINITY_DN20376_c0_g1_i3.p2 TRINITY_DN20376_c0_g1~~TRINITY_DN20376_c0_g1_i3.p2  ORF type:complete len:278 (+),score=78.13 TRINITY_DN20376_c0_g1_i3:72-905(+)
MADMLGLQIKRSAADEGAASAAKHAKQTQGKGKGTSKNKTSAMDTDTKEEAADTPTPAAAASKQRGQPGRQLDKNELQGLLLQVAQLTLHNETEVKQVRSLLIHTVLSSKEGLGEQVVHRTKDTITTYLAHVKGLQHKERQDFSGPHIFVWQELVCVLSEHAGKAEDVVSQKAHKHHLEVLESKAQQKLKDGAKDLAEARRRVLENMVHTCRVNKCWNPTRAKVEFAITDPEAASIMEIMISQLVKNADGERKGGAPPKSDLHRKIAKVLSSHNNKQ